MLCVCQLFCSRGGAACVLRSSKKTPHITHSSHSLHIPHKHHIVCERRGKNNDIMAIATKLSTGVSIDETSVAYKFQNFFKERSKQKVGNQNWALPKCLQLKFIILYSLHFLSLFMQHLMYINTLPEVCSTGLAL